MTRSVLVVLTLTSMVQPIGGSLARIDQGVCAPVGLVISPGLGSSQ